MNTSLSAALLVAVLSAQSVSAFDPTFDVYGTLSGVAEVRDGDGLLFGSVEVRLRGIAAPEDRRGRVDPGGKDATAALEALVSGRFVICYLDGTTAGRTGRPVGVCALDGQDIGLTMVQNGWARDCPNYSQGRYKDAERQARMNGKDLSKTYALPKYC